MGGGKPEPSQRQHAPGAPRILPSNRQPWPSQRAQRQETASKGLRLASSRWSRRAAHRAVVNVARVRTKPTITTTPEDGSGGNHDLHHHSNQRLVRLLRRGRLKCVDRPRSRSARLNTAYRSIWAPSSFGPATRPAKATEAQRPGTRSSRSGTKNALCSNKPRRRTGT